jgi:hypothetical protein
MAAGRIFSRIAIEYEFKVFELVIKLGDITIIPKPSNI